MRSLRTCSTGYSPEGGPTSVSDLRGGIMIPQFGGTHHLQAQAFTGWDAFVLPLLPRGLRLRAVARKILRHHKIVTKRVFRGKVEPVPAGFTFSLPGEMIPYEIVDTAGRVRPYVRSGSRWFR